MNSSAVVSPVQLVQRSADSAGLAALADHWPGLSNCALRLLASRGLSGPADSLTLHELLPPDTMVGLSEAADSLLNAIDNRQSLWVVGDYDVDGATATALLVHALTHHFQARVDFRVPNRFRHGYGLTVSLVEEMLASGPAPDWIITVDNGIASHDGIRAAQAAGVRVLVTDHHLPGETPCPADITVNPNQPGCGFPSKAACGCTVAFYLLMRLRQQAMDRWADTGWLPPNLGDYLDLVALATIADVVTLDGNNRVLVEQGLRRMRAGHLRPGLQAILDLAGRDPRYLSSQDFGFVIGPRLNAAGRMDDMTIGIRCLLAESVVEAEDLASVLETRNRDRKERQKDMVEDASALLPVSASRASAPGIQVLWQASWHEGIVGLVAGQLKEQLNQPVLALCPSDEPGCYKGSARSIPGVHIRDVLAWVDANWPGLLIRFGGHAMAAGLTVAEHRLQQLQEALHQAAQELVPDEAWTTRVYHDGALAQSELSLSRAREIESLGPWGQGCPEPVFCNTFRVVDGRWLNGGHLKLRLSPDTAEAPQAVDAIWFRCPWAQNEPIPARAELLYVLTINRFRGREQVQIMVRQAVVAGDASG